MATLISREETHVRHIYDKIAHHFNKTRLYHWNWVIEFQEHIVQTSSSSTPPKVIDIGCGTGRNMMTSIARTSLNMTGIDNSSSMIAICREKGLHQTYQTSVLSLPFDDNTYDYGMCIAMFHHLETASRREKALREMWRVLKPGGKLILSVWSIEQPKKTRRKFDHYGDTIVPYCDPDTKQTYNRYYYIFTIPEITDLFSRTNFKVDTHFWDCGNEIFVLSKPITLFQN